jgi:hypothetical protein
MILGDEEEIARAICSDKFDPATGRLFTSLFKGPNTSVSRLAVIRLADQWHTLASTVQKLPGRRLEKIGVIGVGRLRELGAAHTANGKPHRVSISVVAKREDWNEAHAEIVEKLPDGLCNTINRSLQLHSLPAGFDPETVPRVIP